MEVLSSDRPLVDPNNDKLGYAPFAEQLAKSITHLAPSDGLVMAIYGPWGSGKTTVLNFVKFYINEVPKDERPVTVDFNPWWFAGHEDLTFRFFDQLLSVLSRRKVLTEGLRKKLAGFAALIAESPGPEVATKSAKIASRLMAQNRDLASRKRDIVDELRKQSKKILVVIDDIDRLSADEVAQLFQVTKAVADFPNVVYLLALDKVVAVKALKRMQGLPGEAYLEKIVQVPFELPLPDKLALRRLLWLKLDQVLASTPDDLLNHTYWGNVYFEGLDRFIETPRHIVVLTNTLGVTYPAVRGEVNAVDFIAIEALRVFRPELYELIRRNPQAFTGHSMGASLLHPSIDSLKPFHQTWLNKLEADEQGPTKALLLRLFPKMGAIWGNTCYGSDSEATWRRQRRICSAEVFPVFFRLAVPAGGISNIEMNAALELTADSQVFGQYLLGLANELKPDGTTRVRELLERLEDYTAAEIPADNIPAVVEALLDIGDQLLRPEDEPRGMFEFGTDIRIVRVLYQLLRRLDGERRAETLKRAITNGSAISIIVLQVGMLVRQQGKHDTEPEPGADWLVTATELEELQELALQKVRQTAKNGALLSLPRLPSVLYSWKTWATDDEVKKWVADLTDDDDSLLALVATFGSNTFEQTLSDTVGRSVYRLNPKNLEPFLDLRATAERLKRIIETKDLAEEQRKAASQFLREYELVVQGKDPDSPTSWM